MEAVSPAPLLAPVAAPVDPVNENPVSDEVDQALDDGRQRAERLISLYRVGMLFFMELVGLLPWVLTRHFDPFSEIFGLVYLSYAIVLAVMVRRWTCSHWLSAITYTVDTVSAGLFFTVLIPRFSGNFHPWTVYAFPAVLFATVSTSFLRLSVPIGVLGGVLASGVYLVGSAQVDPGIQPARYAVAMMLALVGVLASVAARRTRENLDGFARLQLLRRYLPPAAVERVMENPRSALSLGGRLVRLTIMSTDLRGFTAMSETLSPEEVVRQLNRYHGAMLEVVDAHGGVLDKFMGDGALIVFGMHLDGARSEPDHGAQAAVSCARAMLVRLDGLNAERRTAGLPPLKMGIGIHTGEVVAGNIGAWGRRLEFTVIGDAVNTASRLESATKELGVEALCSEAVASHLASRAGLRPLPPVNVRGKQTALAVFALG